MAAEQAAVALLARRDHASAELAARLAEQGYERELVAALVAQLQERRLLDDERYAGHYVAYRAARGQGPMRIRRDLGELGVAEVLVDAALAAGPDWRQLALELRRRRFGAEVPEVWAEKARQARFLQYRGFSNDHIRAALGPDIDADS